MAPIDAGLEGTVPYLVADFLSAEALDAAIRQYGPAPAAQAMRILTSVAAAVDFAAAAGINHGALHPRDVLVTPDDTHLTGVGVGRALETIGLRAPMRRPYVAPERVQRESWDSRADVHSLGVLARELLVGRSRTERDGDVDPRLPQAQVDLLLPVFAKATAARPADRFSTSLELVGALQDVLGGPKARPATAGVAPDGEQRRSGDARARHTHDLLLPLESDAVDEPASATLTRAEDEALAGTTPSSEAVGAYPADALGQMDIDRDRIAAGQSADVTDLSRGEGHVLPERAPALDRFTDVPGFAEEAEVPGFAEEVGVPRFAEEFEDTGEPGAASPEGAAPLSESVAVEREISPFDERLARVEPEPAAVGLPRDIDPAVEPARDLEPPVEPVPLPSVPEVGPEPAVPADREPAIVRSVLGVPASADAPRQRSRTLPMALMLVVGLVVGGIGGYLLGAKQGGGDGLPQATDAAAVRPAPAPQSSAGASGDAQDAGRTRAGQPGTNAAAPATAAPPRLPVGAPKVDETRAKAGAAASAKVNGSLIVRSRPTGASVTVNGRTRGRTPLSLRNLPGGKYTVRVGRSGYATEERVVSLSAQQPSSTLTFSLERSGRTQPASRTEATSTPAAAARSEFYGSVSVESLPAGARVFLDGRLLGTTPLVSARVPAGSHVVRVDRTGFLPWTTSVQVASGQRVRVTASLEREST